MIALVMIWLLQSLLCAFIAQSKGLNVGRWALGGLVFGIFAVVFVALARKPGEVYQVSVDCPACRKRSKAPSNATAFDCPSCHTHFEAPAVIS